MKNKKLTVLLILMTAIVFSLVLSASAAAIHTAQDAGAAAAQKTIVPADGFAGGDGTVDHPYQISNAAELAHLAELINGEYRPERYDYQHAHYILTADIVINEKRPDTDWGQAAPEYNWVPIGIDNPFRGTFDGNQHTISGLYFYADFGDSSNYGEAYGLFGNNQGTIKNLSLTDSCLTVAGKNTDLGGIAGNNALGEARLENCTVDAVLACYAGSCGGLAGNNNGTVSGCAFLGSVRHLREGGDAAIGGIVGYNDGEIADCSNTGTVTAPDLSGTVGGIVGQHHGGVIRSCMNAGEIDGGSYTGGIAGDMFLGNIGGDLKATVCEIRDCVNTGTVRTKADAAGGIAGEATNHHSKYPLQIAGCQNDGTITSAKKTGGIVGRATVSGTVICADCENRAVLGGETTAGIIASVSYHYGSLSVSGCSNSGEITGSMYAGGIIAENNVLGLYLGERPSLDIVVSDCSNTGNLSVQRCGGGVLGVFVCTLDRALCEKISLTLENNRQAADIDCNHFNAFTGGIVGNLGIPYAATTIRGCTADGCIRFRDIPADEETIGLETGRMEFSRMAGGIVGRIGTGLYLSTTGDHPSAEAVNSPAANIRFLDCSSAVRFEAPEESAYTYAIDGKPVYLNRFGGLIGYLSGADGYRIAAEGCRYTNAARGLGNEALPDIQADVQ